ncbi:uncharacterized protein LOC113233391 [Hyposmocoma kahamanoa]|uniref:uncharacterized protein LOC113233391 n=1 Tax=Hyposmocoma kahamanoa TaxID=1477025 RepID=UPI000E6D89FA|nr:uncharacterized protein LOC113233391 [Hyposmocoma kahamanoa]
MAEALWRLRNGKARLLTAVGDDIDGRFLNNIAPGLLLEGCIVQGGRTPTYAVVLDAEGECLIGLGDMALHDHISVDLVNRHLDVLEKTPLVVIDGNVPQSTMDHVLQLCSEMGKPVFFEPTDRRKATKPLHTKKHITLATPNVAELHAMANFVKPDFKLAQTTEINGIIELCKIVSDVVNILVVTLGPKGVITSRRTAKGDLEMRLYPAKEINNIVNVSGAGDCFASSFISGVLTNSVEPKCIAIGYKSATQALLSKTTIPQNLKSSFTVNDAYYETIVS